MSFVTQFQKYEFPNLGYVRLPKIIISKEEKLAVGCPEEASNFEYLKHLAFQGFQQRLINKEILAEEAQIYTEKCQLELETFKKHGLVDYILLIYDILHWCDQNKIPRGIARGSASGSILLYLLGCINIDAIKNNLYFTRFVNEARLQSKEIDSIVQIKGVTAPDVDSDVSFKRRQEVIDYIENKYKGKTAKICTLSRLSGKLLIKEVTKAFLNYNETQAKELSDLVERHFGTVEKINQTYETQKEFRTWADNNKECFELAQKLELLIKNKSRHASGMVISYQDISTSVPLELSSEKTIVTSYDMYEIAKILIKLDLLGLKNADINYEVCKAVRLNPQEIDINHPSIYEYLCNTDSYYGLFQIESGLTKKVVTEIKTKNIDHLAVATAISRPGAYNYIGKFLKYLHEGILETIYPPIDEILEETGNVILYQEQINRICQEVYKMSPISADSVRNCIGKKDKEEMQKWEAEIKQKGEEQNIPREVTEYFWDTCNKSADYLFVRGHAYSYAYMTAINTFLKANYPKEFYLALLKMAKFEPDTKEVIGTIQSELLKTNIRLLPPDLLKSELDFVIENDNIRYGLSSIKGIAEKSFEKLIQFRKPYSNKFEMFISAQQAKLPINILLALIYAGCLEPQFNETRAKIALEAQLFNLLTPREIPLVLQFASKFNYNLIEIIKYLANTSNEKGKLYISNKRMETLRRDFQPYKEIYQQNIQSMPLINWHFENQLIGIAYSTTLKEIFKNAESELLNIQEIKSLENDDYCKCVAEVKMSYTSKSTKGNKYLKMELADETDKINAMIFTNKMIQCQQINGRYPKEGDLVFSSGQKKDNVIFLNNCVIQRNKIIEKISELK